MQVSEKEEEVRLCGPTLTRAQLKFVILTHGMGGMGNTFALSFPLIKEEISYLQTSVMGVHTVLTHDTTRSSNYKCIFIHHIPLF
jgi:hypothetical protein